MTIDKLCQLELHSTHKEASLRFLEGVMGWKAVPISLHEYTVLEVPAHCPYGVSLSGNGTEAKNSPAVVPYFPIEGNWQDWRQKVEALGGSIYSEPRMLPGYGETMTIVDPGGIHLGLFMRRN